MLFFLVFLHKQMTQNFCKFGESRLRAQGVTSGVGFRDCMYACVDAMECGDLDVNCSPDGTFIWDYFCIYIDGRMFRRVCALKPNLKLFWRSSWGHKMIHYPENLLQVEYLWQDLQLVHAYVLHWEAPVIQAELSRRLEWMDSTRRAWLLAIANC